MNNRTDSSKRDKLHRHHWYFLRRKWRYWWGWMRKLTFRRLWNAVLILISFYYSRWFGGIRHPALPISISIEPTTACNLKCPECPSGLRNFTRDTGRVDRATWQKIIDELYPDLWSVLFYFQGEPYIHGDLMEMVRYADQKGLYTMTSTNGHFLDRERAEETVDAGLDELIISIDGLTQEVYSAYRREGCLEKVLEGVKNIVRARNKMGAIRPYIVIQFLVVRPNEHQVPDVYDRARSMGADEVRLKTAQLYNYENGHELMPENEAYSRYEEKTPGRYQLKHSLENHCWKMWHSCVMTWDGQIVPCCFDKDAAHPMGDIRRQNFREIWQGDIYRHFRERLQNGRDQIDICTNCSEGCKIWG